MYGGVRTENGIARAAQMFLVKKKISDKAVLPSEVRIVQKKKKLRFKDYIILIQIIYSKTKSLRL
jgi:hypothetical protein